MHSNTVRGKIKSVALSLLVFAMLTPILAAPAPAYAKDGGSVPRHQGWIQAMPAGGFIGTWKIGGKTFVAMSSTQRDVADGKLVVGGCAKVKYQVVNGQNRALEIDSEPAADCR